MVKVGLFSDTHGYWDDKYALYFKNCDEIWHAGDMGSAELAERLAALKPLRVSMATSTGNPSVHNTVRSLSLKWKR